MERIMRRKLPWSTSDYKKLLPTDLSGARPTPEERIRVAAVLTTICRDASVCGREYPFGMETLRCMLTMSDEEWVKRVPEVRLALSGFNQEYDTEEGEVRFNQVMAADPTQRRLRS